MILDKKMIRQEMKSKLQTITHQAIGDSSYAITEKLIETAFWQQAKTIGVTIPIEKEIDTTLLIKTGWLQNKKIAVPKTNPKSHQMEFYEIKDFNQLETSYYGLKEPMIEKTQFVSSDKIDLLIIPCLAFDSELYRIGYGGGYYDRYLAKYKGQTCGIALDCQKISEVPRNEFDIPLKMIITEDKIYHI